MPAKAEGGIAIDAVTWFSRGILEAGRRAFADNHAAIASIPLLRRFIGPANGQTPLAKAGRHA